MFKREHHVRIATLLQSLNAEQLKACECYFGGGTAIVLSHEEYRESIDIDFICSSLPGYRKLRQMMTEANSLKPIVRKGAQLKTIREIRTDQYGIRTMLVAGEVEIKFEIVFEGRISLDSPGQNDQVCGISALSLVDMATCKLLANSDRWADDSVYSRDIIDLAMLDMSSQSFRAAFSKAESAYGESVTRDLKKAIKRLKENPNRLETCMDALKMESTPKALLWEKIRSLEKYIH